MRARARAQEAVGHGRRRAAALVLVLAGLLAGVAPAAAHKLKVFATVEGGAITGFAFFVGGGRPEGAHVAFRDDAGHDLASAITDTSGAFAFTPAKAEDITVVVDAGDGHSAQTHIAAERLAPLADPAVGAAAPSPAAMAPTAEPASRPAAPAAGCDPALMARLVDEAVARQIRPLLEAEAEAEDKVRFRDVVGGIGMIVGLFGTALWASTRAKARRGSPGA